MSYEVIIYLFGFMSQRPSEGNQNYGVARDENYFDTLVLVHSFLHFTSQRITKFISLVWKLFFAVAWFESWGHFMLQVYMD